MVKLLKQSNIITAKRKMTAHLTLLGLSLGLVTMAAHAAPPVTQYQYDANGNLTKITDGLGHATVQQYDALNRMTVQQQPNPNGSGQLGSITQQYNAIDQRTQVTDPRNLNTTYTYNAFGDVLSLSSPDTGVTSNTYDNAGNLKTRQDAKGQTTTYSYDALNRLTQVSYADGQTFTYGYDQGANSFGHLTGITDSTGGSANIAYSYDNRGHLTGEARTIGNLLYTTNYSYNSAGQLTGIAYPTGLVITYDYDGLGRIGQVSATKNGQTQVLASNITYQPFGGIKSFAYGNGITYTRGYDAEGRLASYTMGGQTITLNYDLAGRIIGSTNNSNAADTKAYQYDNLDRLTGFSTPSINAGYGYDLSGNRTVFAPGVNSYNNTIATNSNRLTAMSGPSAQTLSYDNNGSVTSKGNLQFTYDARNRLIQAITPLGTVGYGINALGQRVIKTTATATTLYHYDHGGQLIAETDAAGTTKQETIYLGNIPLAVMQ